MFQFTQNFQTADRNKVNGADAGNAIYWSQSITTDTFTTTQYTVSFQFNQNYYWLRTLNKKSLLDREERTLPLIEKHSEILLEKKGKYYLIYEEVITGRGEGMILLKYLIPSTGGN